MEKRKLGFFLAALLITHNAYAFDSNEVMKECLAKNGYTPEKFNVFEFSKAAACHQDYAARMNDEKNTELRNFLSENPWYKGKYWDWEKCASNSSCLQNYEFLIR